MASWLRAKKREVPGLSALYNSTQFPNVAGGRDERRLDLDNDSFSSTTSLTASSWNSLVQLHHGIPFVLTPRLHCLAPALPCILFILPQRNACHDITRGLS